MKNKAFTIIELLVVVAIIAVLSTIILFSVKQYANTAKDSNIAGNLAVLIPAGETYYNINNNSYGDANIENNMFCDLGVVTNAKNQMPTNITLSCYDEDTNKPGICCVVASNGQSWAACAALFADPKKAYCVDSRGIKKQICASQCEEDITDTSAECPDILTDCP